MSATRIMLVEDHLSLRQALAFLRGHEPDLEIVAQASSLAQARQMLHTPVDNSITLLSRSPALTTRGECSGLGVMAASGVLMKEPKLLWKVPTP
jgi:DNA-binding NarL/FixJ family response regulator